jgi:hypothetical protein
MKQVPAAEQFHQIGLKTARSVRHHRSHVAGSQLKLVDSPRSAFAFENTSHIGCCPPPLAQIVRPIGDETSTGRENSIEPASPHRVLSVPPSATMRPPARRPNRRMAWLVAARAQQGERGRHVGVLMASGRPAPRRAGTINTSAYDFRQAQGTNACSGDIERSRYSPLPAGER